MVVPNRLPVFLQISEQVLEFTRGLRLYFGRILPAPVVKTLAALDAEVAGGVKFLQQAPRLVAVVQERHQRLLCQRMGIETADVLLLDQAGDAHARGEHLARAAVDFLRGGDAFVDQVIGFVQDGVLQAVDQQSRARRASGAPRFCRLASINRTAASVAAGEVALTGATSTTALTSAGMK